MRALAALAGLALLSLALAASQPAAFSYWNYATYLNDPTCNDQSMVGVASTIVGCMVRCPRFRPIGPRLTPSRSGTPRSTPSPASSAPPPTSSTSTP